jgi:hypothetical protein
MFRKNDILLIREYYDYGFWLQRKVELWIPGILVVIITTLLIDLQVRFKIR